MLVCPIIPFALPRVTRTLAQSVTHTFARPVARILATLVFRIFVSAYLINTRTARVHIPPARSRVALDYVVCQNVVLIWREVHVLQFIEGGNRFRVCRVKSGIMAKNPKVNLNVF